jgi:prepilin signal peptidase PulO-like enzyme (type II secretory pathway)
LASKPSISHAIVYHGGDCFPMVVLDMVDLAIQPLSLLMVTRTQAFLIKQILALVVFIWTIMVLVLFIPVSPILGVIVLTISKTILQVAGKLEAGKGENKADVVCAILIKEDREVKVVITILVS